MALTLAALTATAAPSSSRAAGERSALSPNRVEVYKDDKGFKLKVDGEDFLVLGFNWGYRPVGHNYRYNLWGKSDAFIKKALERHMGLLKAMGVNTIRQFPDIPPRWVTYIYQTYGIHTVMNHTTGRYGFMVDGAMMSPVDYSNEAFRKAVRDDIKSLVQKYKDTPGIIMWMLGNENNYGLEWSSYEIEALPKGEQAAKKAEFLYSLWGEIVSDIKAIDTTKPVAIANGDLQYIDLINRYVVSAGLDIFGSNVYRGISSRDLFDVVLAKTGLPFVYTEFGSDAYNAKEEREDHMAQAEINKGLWQEVYEFTYGKGRAGNAIGGLHFQFSDGWWKYQQETNLDVHDTNASWPNAAYPFDYVEGKNNMNEEWFGICAKGPNDSEGLMPLYPRSSYYVLQKAFELDPYAEDTTLERIRQWFGAIKVEDHSALYEATLLRARATELERFKVNEIRMEIETFNTGGSQLADPDRERDRFGHLESFYLDFAVRPTTNLSGRLRLNVLANVPDNPIDEIFYENRGVRQQFTDADGDTVTMSDLERVAVHGASVEWNEDWFLFEFFYRTGHYHWGYEGDFFGLYPEANYGENLDIYNGAAPFGFVWSGKKALDGLKIAFGPEIYWGANPQIIGKYRRTFGKTTLTLMHHEDIAEQGDVVSSSAAVPEQLNRRTTLAAAAKFGALKVEVGVMSSGSTKVGDRFRIAEETTGQSYLDSGYLILEDTVKAADTLAGKAKLTFEQGNIRWYLQGAYKGLVADGGADQTQTFTGWRLKEDGRGNHWNVLAGTAINFGSFQLAPNFLYQQPLEGPLPLIGDHYNVGSGVYYPGVAGRNILNDPFVVRGNREQLAAELLLVWDPTPGTWMWSWDNEIVEDADVAMSLNFVYRHLPTIQDGGIGRLEDGTAFGFATSAPAKDLWEVTARAIFNPDHDLRLRTEIYGGTGQANGDDSRLVERFGTSLRLVYSRLAIEGQFKLNDWGPYDYHRDFNFTFPVQLMGDLSWGLTMPKWLGQLYTRFGVRAAWRTLDEFSNRYHSDPDDPDELGQEWEIRTYLHVSL